MDRMIGPEPGGPSLVNLIVDVKLGTSYAVDSDSGGRFTLSIKLIDKARGSPYCFRVFQGQPNPRVSQGLNSK